MKISKINSVQITLSKTLIILLFLAANIYAQPSGGPYGPIPTNYEIPKTTANIFYVSTDGSAENTGREISAPTTIEEAVAKAHTGDVLILRGGTYRTGNLIFNQGITIQPYKDEQPVLKGTLIAKEWTNLGNGLWTTKWNKLFPSEPADWWRRHREGKKTPMHRFNNDMVFVDGKFLQSAGWEGEVDENTFYIDYKSGLVYIGIDPTDKLVEITAFDCALLRTIKDYHGRGSDRKGPVIRGITFTQYAYRAIEIEGIEPEGLSPEAKHGKDVVGSVFENCTISFCSRVAGYFRGDKLVMRNCKISDTSTEGVYIIGSSDVLLEKNIFTRNNIEQITGYYPAAVKIFNQSYRVTCNDNLVIDHPYSNGIWYDVGNVDGVFTNNWLENIGNNKTGYDKKQLWPSDNAFFFEISKGVICAGNVFVNCDHGVLILNSSNAQIYNNTFVNSMVCIGRNTRSAVGDHFGWHPSTGPDVNERDGNVFENNILYGDELFTKRPLMYVWQPDVLCKELPNSQLKRFDYNVFISKTNNVEPIVLWSPANQMNCQIGINHLEELNKLYPEFMRNSKYFGDAASPFKSIELKNFELVSTKLISYKAVKLDFDIAKKTGVLKEYVGAYPPTNKTKK
ncbi:MAG: hypothetical protein FD143_1137 [Ignavibacteria bacterium]|nr:MAG: hypothetical protein FD143_1137 [Ignavibacteria bacterium]KAF0160849.1 MAG: hypothetical protein FD188_1348 [Ignavibacteria bacterium]